MVGGLVDWLIGRGGLVLVVLLVVPLDRRLASLRPHLPEAGTPDTLVTWVIEGNLTCWTNVGDSPHFLKYDLYPNPHNVMHLMNYEGRIILLRIVIE